MELKLTLKHSIIIAVILLVAFLSQLGYFKPALQYIYTPGIKSENSSVGKAQEWLKNNIYDKLAGVSGEVAKTEENVKQQITDQKNNLQKKSTEALKKFLAEKILQTLGVTPQDLGATACPAR